MHEEIDQLRDTISKTNDVLLALPLLDETIRPQLHKICKMDLEEPSRQHFENINDGFMFLLSAISRAQDYVKAASNIALSPKLETVNALNVMRMVHRLITNQSNGYIVTVDALSETICAHLITDKHYLQVCICLHIGILLRHLPSCHTITTHFVVCHR